MTATEIDSIRMEIEGIDQKLISLIEQRVRCARRLGQLKSEAGLPTLDPTREAAVVRRASESARTVGLPEEEIREIFWHLIGLSRRAQSQTL